MKQQDGLAAWLRLMATEGVGSQTARDLLTHFGLPEEIFNAGFSALQKRIPEKIARILSAPIAPEIQTHIEQTLAWAAQENNHVITLADTSYPQALLRIADPPTLLYAKGNSALLNKPSIAIVGSRNASAQGMLNADRFAQNLSDAGLTVVSGLALGIDTGAHTGALQSAKAANKATNIGSSIAVVGTGLDIVYPAANRALAHQLADVGCIISEYPLGTPAIAHNFPRRNRIISGLSLGVLVVEAAAQSGSLITARSALEQGREVFAIPGSIHSPLAKGCHQLIRQGAKLVESAQDILEELRWDHPLLQASSSNATQIAASNLSDPKLQSLLENMGHDALSVDQLVARSGLPVASVQAALLHLEMQGHIECLAGGQVRRLIA
jgi:DNA processing protein